MHLPLGIPGWTVFATGLLIIAYRVHGVDAPRQWIEFVERQFTYSRNLIAIGIVLLTGVLGAGYIARSTPPSTLGQLFWLSLLLLASIGLCLILLQNHLRHLLLATAEGNDAKIRLISIGIVIIGLLWTLAPFVL